MAVAAEQYLALSPSSQRALGFAEAAARHRAGEPDPAVEPADLLVGLLLSHPDEEGEARILLGHFGLTARDVLPGDYPPVSVEDLRRHAAGIRIDTPQPLSEEVERAVLSASEGKDEVHLRHLLGALLHLSGSPLLGRLQERLAATGSSLTQLAAVYERWLADPVVDKERAETAGRQLREVLEREMPRRPVDVPSYAPDRVRKREKDEEGVEGEDLIGIQREVDAFAYLLASKAQRPPLAVGLFGDWGSGKSFFMRAVHDRVDTIKTQIKDRPQADVPFWKEVRQIEFNAWEYVRGELWASLLDHIFQELGETHVGLLESRYKELREKRQEAWSRATDEAAERKRLDTEVSEDRKALEEAKRERDEGLKRISRKRPELISKRLAAAQPEMWGDAAKQLAGKDTAELAAAVGEARAELLRSRGLLGAYWTRDHILLATGVALVVPGVALAAEALNLPAVVSLLGGLSALVPAITGLLRSATNWTRCQVNQLEKVARDVEEELGEEERELDTKVEAAEKQFEHSAAELAAAGSAEETARKQVRRLRRELMALTPGRVLGEFLQERSRSDDYRRHLGLMAQVRRDLGELEELVRKNNDSKAEQKNPPPNRIILYIDDLDRCSSDKVLDVLEAVHLLLAFELFVVVVAVDSRWLSSALTHQLPGLDRSNRGGRRATPQDYLEKIFQLPFWVQPLREAGRRSLVHGLLESSVRAPGGNGTNDEPPAGGLAVGEREEQLLTAMLSRRGADPRLDAHLLALTAQDLSFMESLAPLLGDTPRRVKRFVNITQLLLALPPAFEREPYDPPADEPGDREVVAFLAAVNSGLPGLAPKLFDAVEPKSAATLGTTVEELTAVPEDEQQSLMTWLAPDPGQKGRKNWSEVRLCRFHPHVDIVRRINFTRESVLLAHHVPGHGG